MIIKIDPKKLDDDSFYFLHKALEKIKNPNNTVKNAIKEFDEISVKRYDKWCQERGSWEFVNSMR